MDLKNIKKNFWGELRKNYILSLIFFALALLPILVFMSYPDEVLAVRSLNIIVTLHAYYIILVNIFILVYANVLFGYVNKSTSLDVEHVLPLKRSELFFSKFISLVCFSYIPILFSLLIEMCVFTSSVNNPLIFQSCLLHMFNALLYVLFISAFTIFLLMTFNRNFDGILAFFGFVIAIIVVPLMVYLYIKDSGNDISNFYDIFSGKRVSLSEFILNFLRDLPGINIFHSIKPIYHTPVSNIISIIIVILMIGLALKTYQKKSGENMDLTSDTNVVFRLLQGLGVFSAALVGGLIGSLSYGKYLLFFIFAIIFAVILFIILEMIYVRKLSFKVNKFKYIITPIFVFFIFCAGIHFDFLNIYTRKYKPINNTNQFESFYISKDSDDHLDPPDFPPFYFLDVFKNIKDPKAIKEIVKEGASVENAHSLLMLDNYKEFYKKNDNMIYVNISRFHKTKVKTQTKDGFSIQEKIANYTYEIDKAKLYNILLNSPNCSKSFNIYLYFLEKKLLPPYMKVSLYNPITKKFYFFNFNTLIQKHLLLEEQGLPPETQKDFFNLVYVINNGKPYNHPSSIFQILNGIQHETLLKNKNIIAEHNDKKYEVSISESKIKIPHTIIEELQDKNDAEVLVMPRCGNEY